MAITTASDISIVLSGGSGNLDPNDCLGGNPSATPVISTTLNNLFDDISPDQANIGHEDYRCLYLFNDGDTTIYNPKLWILSDFIYGSSISMGIESRNERQRITITDAIPTSGTITLTYNTVSFVSTARSDISQWASEMQAQLLALELSGEKLLTGVSVTAQLSGSTTLIFEIAFSGQDAKKSHSKITASSNNLSPSCSITISVPQSGAPINTIAQTINVETTPPGGVDFVVPTESSPISLPQLKPEEGFPFWIKRSTAAGTTAVENDGFSLQFVAESLASE